MKSSLSTTLLLLLALFSFSNLHAQIEEAVEEAIFKIAPIQTEPVAPSIPIATIEFSETEFDFGIIEQGETVKHIFTFTNTSEEVLILTNAKGSCGCTVPEWPKDAILPGETASIVVRFNSKGKKNKQNKKVTLTSNTEPAQSFLYLKGEVHVPEEGEGAYVAKEKEAIESSPDCFMIYPNPTAELLQLDLKKSTGKTAIVTIVSKSGQLMARREIKEVKELEIFNVSHYPAGTYVANVQIEGKKRSESKCFVVTE